METRFSVDSTDLLAVYEKLKSEGYTLDDISEEIGSDFRNYLYKGTTFSKNRLKRLESIYGEKIDSKARLFVNGAGEKRRITLTKEEKLAELVGVILGDGHIDKHSRDRGDRFVSSYYLSVTLNSSEEELREHVIDLIKSCVGRQPKVEKVKGANAVNLKLYGREVVEALEHVGLVAGNKVEKQVSVPSWIKESQQFKKACLRGLVDTDGSVYRRSQDGYWVVHFKNRSRPLLDDFVEMCEDLGINASKAGHTARQVASQQQVKNFIRDIDPIKGRKIDLSSG